MENQEQALTSERTLAPSRFSGAGDDAFCGGYLFWAIRGGGGQRCAFSRPSHPVSPLNPFALRCLVMYSFVIVYFIELRPHRRATGYATVQCDLSVTNSSLTLQRRSLGARPQSARHIRSGHGASCEGAHRGLSRVEDHAYRLGAERVEVQSGTLSIECMWGGG